MGPLWEEAVYKLASFVVEVEEAGACCMLAFPDNFVLQVEEHTEKSVLALEYERHELVENYQTDISALEVHDEAGEHTSQQEVACYLLPHILHYLSMMAQVAVESE